LGTFYKYVLNGVALNTPTGPKAGLKRPGLRNVVALGFVSMLNDISSEMVFSLLPLFIVQELHASKGILGLIEGLAQAVDYIFRVPSGILSDKFSRRKPLVLLGYSISTAMKPLFAFVPSWVHALFVRVGDRVGKGIRTSPRDVLISESVPSEELGRSFGVHRTLDQIGAIVGPLLAIPLVVSYGMKGVFIFSLIPGLIAVFILLLFVRETKGGGGKGFEWKGIGRRFWSFIVVAFVLYFSSYNFSFVLLRAEGFGVATALIPLVYALINASHTVVSYPMGLLSDRIGREKVFALGFALLALSSLISTLQLPYYFAFLVAALYGAHEGIVMTIGRALVPIYSSEDALGSAYGLYYLALGSSQLLGNVVFGLLWDSFGLVAAFTFSIAFSLLGLLMLLLLLGRHLL